MRLLSLVQSNLNTLKALLVFVAIMLSHTIIEAQATLSVQGIVKKSNGVALEDGVYPITFKIYVVDSTQVKWSETIPNVEVISGIYSVILGEITALTLPFDKDYELGISIGTQEMLPKIRLTSAPYALSLRGETNQFPSTGLVLADNIKVADGILASGGTPGLSGVNKNGYGFIGNNDTGLFSTGYGKVSLFTTNVEVLEATPTGVTVHGTLGANNINLYSNGGISYSTAQGSFQGWRLADVDDFNSGVDGWNQYSPAGSEQLGWSSGTIAPNLCHCGPEGSASGLFLANFLMVSDRNNVLKKQYTIAQNSIGNFSEIKVKFRYVVIDSWDQNQDYGFAGFANDINGTVFKLAWYESIVHASGGSPKLNSAAFKTASQFRGNSNTSDHWIDVEMTAKANGNSFWVFIGAAMEGDLDEIFGLGPVEVWVR